MTVIAIVQARYSSTRLPGKVLADVCGKAMLTHQIERLVRSVRIDKLVVATSIDPEDDKIVSCAQASGIDAVRGSLKDVLARFQLALTSFPADTVVRLTGDSPLTDPELIDRCIDDFQNSEPPTDYLSNTLKPTFPDGLDVEVFSRDILQIAANEAFLSFQREHVTPFIYTQPSRFHLRNYTQKKDLSFLRWTVDEPEDLNFVRSVYEELYPTNRNFSTKDILTLLRKKPFLIKLNAHIKRNEGSGGNACL